MITPMRKAYVEKKNGGYWISGTRISLDSIVYSFKRGAAPETIKRSFPLLTLEEIYGALTFYLAHKRKIEAYLDESEKQLNEEAAVRRSKLQEAKPALIKRLKNEEVLAR